MVSETEKLIAELPDSRAARRFVEDLAAKHPEHHSRLVANAALLSDAATLAAFSPLLATTLLQTPEYLWWLDEKRRSVKDRGKDVLIASLRRFAQASPTLDPQVIFTRFRRRELLRIYLRDIRRLATIAEITAEISNLADATLEFALEMARREVVERFGDAGSDAAFCVIALGKLGSRELNYSSDIDLVFLYSDEGISTGGRRDAVTNREYFVKLAEHTIKLIGGHSGEGTAYRVDVRLRPHGTLGPLAVSLPDTVRYYRTEARAWERQVMVRSRCSAGDAALFKRFYAEIEPLVFVKDETVEAALANARASKDKIDLHARGGGFNVKLGRGAIREIEFIAQALQLAYGGRDRWLREGHTLISLARLADRGHLSEGELTQLSSAYEFLRRTEHVLQMENGLQTHTVPDDADKRALLARRIEMAGGDFESDLVRHTDNVARIFTRVFGEAARGEPAESDVDISRAPDRTRAHVMASLGKAGIEIGGAGEASSVLDRLITVSPRFAAMIAANPQLVDELARLDEGQPDYSEMLMTAVTEARGFRERLSALRKAWSRLLLNIVVRDVYGQADMFEAKRLQTLLGEASIAAALEAVRAELSRKFAADIDVLHLAVLGLGKLGGRGLDYDSDLDMVLVYDDKIESPVASLTAAEFYARAAELLVTTLSSMTRDGSLYRVDLRLRPYGSKGLTAMPGSGFLDYMQNTAAVWEMLAFVKLRAAGGDMSLGEMVEQDARQIIHERALSIDRAELAAETRRVRLALEKQRSRARRGKEIDIKYGEGGMLDVYFAMRFLQLLHNVPDDTGDRSTTAMLDRLSGLRSLKGVKDEIAALRDGYRFLSALDHNLRLTVGRTTRVPLGKQAVLETIAARMKHDAAAELLQKLTLRRITIREAFLVLTA